jgi:uncharacterized protein
VAGPAQTRGLEGLTSYLYLALSVTMGVVALKRTRPTVLLLSAVLITFGAASSHGANPSTSVSATTPGSAQYSIQPQLLLLRFGEIKPSGWLLEQMQRDLAGGLAGHLPEIAPRTAKSDIFTTGRNRARKLSDPGGQGGEQWWNGETEGNWRSGNTMMTLLAGTPEQRAGLDARIAELLKSQDKDGYLGIYAPELRWRTTGDSGELWTQTCLFRGLIAYYEATGKAEVLDAVERAVQLTIHSYSSRRFSAGQHSLMFADVTERLYDLTGNPIYRDFGLGLCRDMAQTGRGAAGDMSMAGLLDPTHLHQGHGATTCESLRLPVWAACVTGAPGWLAACDQAFGKALRQVSPTGAPISEEAMQGRVTDPDTAAYECCTQKEWMTSALSALQKFGKASFGDQAENTFYNSVQGARLPDGKAVSYCSKDNCYSRTGEQAQRIKYSPCHEDVANCCAPNFTQIGPLFTRNLWMRSPDGLAAVLYAPCQVSTVVGSVPVVIKEDTSYPIENRVALTVNPERPTAFTLRLRVPGWCMDAAVTAPGASVVRVEDWLLVTKDWRAGDSLGVVFKAQVQPVPANNREFYVRFGPLFYAYPIPSVMKSIKDYPLPDFHDYHVTPAAGARWNYALPKFWGGSEQLSLRLATNAAASMRYPWDAPSLKLVGTLVNLDTRKPEHVELIPMGSGGATLRRCTFPCQSGT